jgi:hypothetical protein
MERYMKKLWMALLILPIFLLTGCNFLPQDNETTLEVDLDNYFQIETVDQLKEMAMNQSYQLMNDLDLNGEEWVPIGGFSDPYMGNFNGNGYTISNFTITENHMGFNGLFGYVEGDIENLNLSDFTIDIEDDFMMNVGGLAGVTYGSVDNVIVNGDISVQSDYGNIYAGLLVGQAMTDLQDVIVNDQFLPNLITNNSVGGSLEVVASQINYIGGLIGKAHNVEISQNRVNGLTIDMLQGSSTFLGGLVGHQFLYDFETIDAGLNIDKMIVYENIVDVDITIDGSLEIELGGLVGYAQNTHVENNVVQLKLDARFDGLLSFGLAVGENWVGNITSNIVILSEVNSDISVDAFGDVVAKKQSEASVINGFYNIPTTFVYPQIEPPVSFGTSVDLDDLNGDEFYTNHFSSLSNEFISEIQSLLAD